MKSNKAFTLVELMIVISIVGLLSSIATPKMSDMVRKANEALSKNNLGVLRSVTAIYYADHSGVWPYQNTAVGADDFSLLSTLDSGAAVAPKYISAIPPLKTGIRVPVEGKNEVAVAIDGGTYYDYETRACHDFVAAWVYLKDIGMWYINCDATDTKNEGINTW